MMGSGMKISIAMCAILFVSVYGQQQARGFQIRTQEASAEEKKDLSAQPATLQQQLRTRQLVQQPQSVQNAAASSASYEYSEEEEDAPIQTYQRPIARQYHQHPQQHQQQQQINNNKKQTLTKKQKQQFEEELEDEVEEPDMLKMLLEKSSFSCHGKTTGYYSDDTVGCQVFHYCHENTKHSWICPEGATFHQVHLICMPPSDENICEQSAKYHFVNDYLYKPINMEEHKSKPNVSLRYHDRYFPENFYNDDRSDYDDDHHAPAPQQVRYQPKPVARIQSKPTTAASNYRQQQQQQNVFRSPDEVNISLQQRRPYFTQTTTRYDDDDEYSYEK